MENKVIYINGDSYMCMSTGLTLSDHLAQKLNTKVQNKSIPGSSNQRIMRTALRDLLKLKNETNEKITAIISLSFIYRQSIWDPLGQAEKWKHSNDGEFACYQIFAGSTWLQKLKNNKTFNYVPHHLKKYYKEYALLYDHEAEITNLLQQIELFSAWCENNKISYIIFSGPEQEDKIDLNAPFVEPFYESISKKYNILDIFNFSFCEYCISQGFTGFDFNLYGKYAHHNQYAHEKFADFLIDKYNLKYEI